jgi:hypothetical protein
MSLKVVGWAQVRFQGTPGTFPEEWPMKGGTVFYCYRTKAPGSETPKKLWVMAQFFRKGAMRAEYPIEIMTTDSQVGILRKAAAKRGTIWWREGFAFKPPEEGVEDWQLFQWNIYKKGTKYEFKE